jgi:hypothetical protein
MNDEDRRRDAERALERVRMESEVLGSSSLVRAAGDALRHLGGADAPKDDPIELWGRRIGRSLGVVFVIYLLYTLAGHFMGR